MKCIHLFKINILIVVFVELHMHNMFLCVYS